MSRYVDGFLLTVPKKNLRAYKRLAVIASKIWKKHGALEYHECLGDDLDVKFGVPFPKIIKPKKGETVFFSYIAFKSRAHRDVVNKKVMNDPKLAASMDMNNLPFDCKRMAYGGFKVFVEA